MASRKVCLRASRPVFADAGVGIGNGFGPMVLAADAGNFEAGGVGFEDFFLVVMAYGFDAFEAGFFRGSSIERDRACALALGAGKPEDMGSWRADRLWWSLHPCLNCSSVPRCASPTRG